MTVKTSFSDFGKAQDSIEAMLPDIEYEVCETAMIPHDYVTLSDKDEIAAFNKLMNMLNDSDDVNKIYHNVIIEE